MDKSGRAGLLFCFWWAGLLQNSWRKLLICNESDVLVPLSQYVNGAASPRRPFSAGSSEICPDRSCVLRCPTAIHGALRMRFFRCAFSLERKLAKLVACCGLGFVNASESPLQ